MEKKYVEVEALCSEGRHRPIRVRLEDGRVLNIRRTLHAAHPVEDEYEGIRYTILIGSAEKYLYLDGNRWYVEPSFGKEDTS